MVTLAISEIMSVYSLNIFPETGQWQALTSITYETELTLMPSGARSESMKW